jgi:hypothetical protein
MGSVISQIYTIFTSPSVYLLLVFCVCLALQELAPVAAASFFCFCKKQKRYSGKREKAPKMNSA